MKGQLALQRFRPLAWVFALSLTACSAAQPAPAPLQQEPSGRPVDFLYRGTGDVVFDSEQTRGRATIVALVTTYDMASQLLLRRIDEAVRSYRPRANAGAVVMEPRRYEVLLDTYREALDLSFPVVLADLATREGRGPFGGVDFLPVMIVLDAQGRIVERHVGQVESKTILDALGKASPKGRAE